MFPTKHTSHCIIVVYHSVLKYMIKNRFVESKNYPSRLENKEDKLVQWCHGAPGVALTLCKAAEVCLPTVVH